MLHRALLEHPELIDWALLPRAVLGLVALLCGNGYIVGINQIYDVDIDVLNKPFLPVASGGAVRGAVNSPGVAYAAPRGIVHGTVCPPCQKRQVVRGTVRYAPYSTLWSFAACLGAQCTAGR